MRDPVSWPARDFLSHRAAATPDRTALVETTHGRRWTYRAFDTIVADVAAQLLDCQEEHTSDPNATGDARRPRVGCLLTPRVSFVATFYAALRVGWVPVPLQTDLGSSAFETQFESADPDLLVCEARSEALAVGVAGSDCPVLSVDPPESVDATLLRPTGERPDAIDREMGTVEPVERDPHETAAILFTSGTTGDPAGVRLTAENLAASATASAFRLGVEPGDRWLGCLPVYHMGGLAPVVRSVLYGTTLVLQREFDAGETATALSEYDATGVSLVPTQLVRLLDSGWDPPSSLRAVLLGGAPASESLRERALEAGVAVYPTYGMTETASQIATATPEQARKHPGTVGQPLVFTDVTVLADGEPADPGERGKIVVDGPTVTPGYLDADATEEAFDEWGFHTGDLGYRDADGRLWVVGRRDDAILTGGELVIPGDVEKTIRGHPAVSDVAVVGIEDEHWGERVAALVVPVSGATAADADGTDRTDVDAGGPIARQVREHCRDRLADFKLPKTVVSVDTLPRTASGTVDREVVRETIRRSRQR